MESEIITKLIEHGPIVMVLAWVIWRDSKKIQAMETEIRELNAYIRDSEKESISYIKDLNKTLENLTDKIQ